MKLIFKILIIALMLVQSANCTEVYSVENKFGLQKDDGSKITEAIYNKLIRLGDSSYLFMYKNKYGIMSDTGEILVSPKYTQAQRYIGRYAKLGKSGKYGLFDQNGQAIIAPEYSSINILYGRMFLVQKAYKYGLISFDGDIILAPVADDIYMPEANILKLRYENEWYEITQVSKETMELPKDLEINDKSDFKIIKLVENPVASTGYGLVSASDYFIKIFSSISPAYESTIDELILSHGADTAMILLNPIWIAKFPFIYVKNYANNFKTPNNGPLADVKANLKNKLN